jgi:hypothetical protein
MITVISRRMRREITVIMQLAATVGQRTVLQGRYVPLVTERACAANRAAHDNSKKRSARTARGQVAAGFR